jgi:hypothetical protein
MFMKPIYLLLIHLWLPFLSLAQSRPSEPRLMGLISLPDFQRAIIAFSKQSSVLGPGQREGNIEVVEIKWTNSSAVVLFENPNTVTLSIGTTNQVPSSGLIFEGVQLHTLLNIYAELHRHSVLRYPSLPTSSRFSFVASASTPTEAAQAIEKQLTEEGIAFIPDGESFIVAVPKSDASRVKPHSPPHTKSTSSSGNTEMIAPGMVDFREVDPQQVAMLYAEWTGRKLDRAVSFPRSHGRIFVKSVNPLTRDEVCYALETLLLWQGIKFVPEGNDMIKPVPVSE